MSKIKRLVIKNCLGIEERAIDVKNLNVISGGNAQGKTSILEVIEKALYNTNRRDKFVRTGAEKAYIELDTDDGLHVERVISKDGKDTVKVLQDGIPIKTPQTFLDQLFGVSKERKDVFAFNPVDFIAKAPKEQSKILLSLMPISFTQQNMVEAFGKAIPINSNQHGLLVLKECEKFWYDARHEANGAVKATKSEVEALENQLPDNYDVEKWEVFSLMELSDNIRNSEQVNNHRKKATELIGNSEELISSINNKFDLQVKEQQEMLEFKIGKAKSSVNVRKVELQTEIENAEKEIKELEKQIEQLKGFITLTTESISRLDTEIFESRKESLTNEMNTVISTIEEKRKEELTLLDTRIVNAKDFLEKCPEVNIKPLEEEYATAEKMKGYVEMAHNLDKVRATLKEQSKTAAKYDSFVEFCRSKPTELLKNVELPVEGLGINDDGLVTINDLPLKNLNTAKQVTVCLDIARAYAKGTVLKLITLDKMEHLDPKVREEFLSQCESDSEYQYFITKVVETIDYEKLKADYPDMFEEYQSSLDLKVESK